MVHNIRCSIGTIRVLPFRRPARPNGGYEPTVPFRANMTVKSHRYFGAPALNLRLAVASLLELEAITVKKAEKGDRYGFSDRHTVGSTKKTGCVLTSGSEPTTASSQVGSSQAESARVRYLRETRTRRPHPPCCQKGPQPGSDEPA